MRRTRKIVLSLIRAMVASVLSLLISSPLMPFVFRFFDLGTPDQKEVAKMTFYLMLIVHGIFAIGIYALLRQWRWAAEWIGDLLATVKHSRFPSL